MHHAPLLLQYKLQLLNCNELNQLIITCCTIATVNYFKCVNVSLHKSFFLGLIYCCFLDFTFVYKNKKNISRKKHHHLEDG